MSAKDEFKAYYKLDETSGDAADSTGNGITLTNTGTVTYSQVSYNGKFDGAATGLASGKYLSTTNAMGIDGGAISIFGWFMPGAYVSGNNCFFGQTNVTSKTTYYVERSSSTNVNFYREKGSVGTQGPSVTYTFSAATWYFVCLTYDGSFVNAYINGVLVGGPTAASGSGSGSITNSGFSINGRIYNSGVPINTFTQQANAVGVINRALTSDEQSIIMYGGQYPFGATKLTHLRPAPFKPGQDKSKNKVISN